MNTWDTEVKGKVYDKAWIQGFVENGLMCSRCLEQLPYIQGPVCLKCGKGVRQEEQEYCRDCQSLPKHYLKGYPVFRYVEPMKKAIYDFKYHNRKEYADFFALSIWNRYGRDIEKLQLQGIIPVPMYRDKEIKRGYNQAELIARRLGALSGLPVYTKMLLRVRPTTPQKELNDEQRMNNLKKSFLYQQKGVKLEKILLVDDIYTSGATVEACTQAMMAEGIKAVYYTSVCIGDGE